MDDPLLLERAARLCTVRSRNQDLNPCQPEGKLVPLLVKNLRMARDLVLDLGQVVLSRPRQTRQRSLPNLIPGGHPVGGKPDPFGLAANADPVVSRDGRRLTDLGRHAVENHAHQSCAPRDIRSPSAGLQRR